MPTKFILQAAFRPSSPQTVAVEQLYAGLKRNVKKQTLLGVTGCGKTFTLANVIYHLQRPTLIIAHNKTLAAQLYGEMQSFFPQNGVEYFVSYYDYYQPEAYLPATNTYIEKDAAINEHIERMRLAATKALFTRSDTIIVASVSAIYGLGDPETYRQMVLELACGAELDRTQLLQRLVELQYTRNDLELRRGTYRAQGEVLDIFPAEATTYAIRLEMDDNILEKISYVDPLTGKKIREVTKIQIFPKTHYVTKRHVIGDAIAKIKIELDERLAVLRKGNKLLKAQRLKERTLYDIEMLQELGYCTGIENYSRYLSGRVAGEPPPTLIDYLPDNALLIIDESHVTLPQLHGMYNGDQSRKNVLVEHGFRLPSALDNRPLKFSEFEKIAPRTIYISATPGDYELQCSERVVELLIRPTGLLDPEVEVRPAKTQIDDLFSAIDMRVLAKERVLVITLTKRLAENLATYLEEYGVKVRYLHSSINTVERVEILRDLRLGVFDVLIGINLLREGLDLPEVSLVAILDADKEGFLRSRQALIQTSGRAARHINGKVIMYAEKITSSMEAALAEMTRRRKIQQKYNIEHNIIPKGITKEIRDILPVEQQTKHRVGYSKQLAKGAEQHLEDDPKKLVKHIKKLEKTMYQHAANLEFEKAADVRDQIDYLYKLLDTTEDVMKEW